MKLYLYEGLNTQDRASVMLWESAGRKLVEAQLTADQITQLFQQIQTAKGNRTLVGKGVDAGSAVMKAYADLKSKVANSGPIKNVDALYDQAAEKLKQATGGDQGAMAYVQKYRDFAKKHPVAQSLIYGALIAAAGITGAGAGGAAALGLFKMVDKLLQGEKFSSAAYSGAKTGAMAYAAGQIGKAMKGDQAQQAGDVAGSDPNGITAQAKELTKDYDPTKYNYVGDGTEINIIDKATGELAGTFPVDMATADEVIAQAGKVGKLASGAVDTATNTGTNQLAARWLGNRKELAQDLLKHYTPTDFDYVRSGMNVNIIDKATGQLVKNVSGFGARELGPISPDKFIAKILSGEYGTAATSAASTAARTARNAAFNAKYPNFESRDLTNKQVLALFERVEHINNRMLTEGRLEEGIWDDIKSGASKGLQGVKNLAGKAVGAVAQGAAKVGRSMTANVSSDALTKAWQAAGSPTDSAEIEKLLQAQGVNPEVVKTVFQANKIPVTPTAPVGQDAANDPTVDAMPDVMAPGGNRPEQGAMAQGVQQAQGGQQPAQQPQPQAQQPQPQAQQPQQAQGGQPQAQQPQQAQGGQQQPGASKLPDVSKLTPEQKKQLLAQVEERLKSLPAPTQQPQPQVQQPVPTQSAQPQVQQPAPVQPPATNVQDQPADLFADPTATPDLKVSPAPKAGLPTPDEQAKYQEKLKAADQTQNKTSTVGAPTPDEQAKLQAKLKAADQAQNKTKPAPKELAESYKEFKFLVDGIKARI